MEQYLTEVDERIDVYAGKTARQKYAKDKRYLDFHACIWVCYIRHGYNSKNEHIVGSATS